MCAALVHQTIDCITAGDKFRYNCTAALRVQYKEVAKFHVLGLVGKLAVVVWIHKSAQVCLICVVHHFRHLGPVSLATHAHARLKRLASVAGCKLSNFVYQARMEHGIYTPDLCMKLQSTFWYVAHQRNGVLG